MIHLLTFESRQALPLVGFCVALPTGLYPPIALSFGELVKIKEVVTIEIIYVYHLFTSICITWDKYQSEIDV